MTTNFAECPYPYDSTILDQILVPLTRTYPSDFTGCFYVRQRGFYYVLRQIKGEAVPFKGEIAIAFCPVFH